MNANLIVISDQINYEYVNDYAKKILLEAFTSIGFNFGAVTYLDLSYTEQTLKGFITNNTFVAIAFQHKAVYEKTKYILEALFTVSIETPFGFAFGSRGGVYLVDIGKQNLEQILNTKALESNFDTENNIVCRMFYENKQLLLKDLSLIEGVDNFDLALNYDCGDALLCFLPKSNIDVHSLVDFRALLYKYFENKIYSTDSVPLLSQLDEIMSVRNKKFGILDTITQGELEAKLKDLNNFGKFVTIMDNSTDIATIDDMQDFVKMNNLDFAVFALGSNSNNVLYFVDGMIAQPLELSLNLNIKYNRLLVTNKILSKILQKLHKSVWLF